MFRHTAPRTISLLLTLSLFLTSTATASDAPSSWKARYIVLSGRYYSDDAITLKLGPTGIQGYSKKIQTLNIPFDKLVGITTDDRIHRPVKDWAAAGADLTLAGPAMADEMGGCDDAGAGYCAVGYAALAVLGFGTWLVGLAVTAPMKETRHFVSFLWSDEHGTMQQALFQLSAEDAKAMVSAVSTSTAKPVLDLIARRQQLRDEIAQAAPTALPLKLDRQATVNGRLLRPGAYLLLVLPRANNTAELFLFAGSAVRLETLAAQALVRIQPPGGDAPPAQETAVRYSGDDKRATVTEIATSTQTLSLDPKLIDLADPTSPYRINLASGAAHSADEVQVLNLKVDDGNVRVALVTYDGRPAFRFPVMHEHMPSFKKMLQTPPICRGYLYVMSDRLAFDPALNLTADRDPFEVQRSELTKVKIIHGSWLMGPGGVLLAWEKHRLEFWAYVEGVRLLDPVSNKNNLASVAEQWRHVSKQLKPYISLLDETLNDFDGTLAKYQAPLPSPPPTGEGSRPSSAGPCTEPATSSPCSPTQ